MALNTNTSIVDLLKSRNMPSDMASRADLAVKYGLATSPQDYATKAQTGGVNTALIAQLKGTGGQTGSMASPTAPVNASTPQGETKTTGMTPTTTTTTTTPKTADLEKLLGTAQGQLTEAQKAGYTGSQEIKYDSSGNIIPAGMPEKPELESEEELKRKAREGMTDQEKMLKEQAEAQRQQNEIYKNQELESTDLTIKHNKDLLYNSLAARGLLEEGATAGVEKLQEFENEAKAIRQKVQDKWNVMNAGLSAALSKDIQDRLDKELEKLRDDQKQKIDNYFTETKMIQESKQRDTENELKKKQLEIDEAYKAGQLTLGEYEAQTARLKANADIRKIDSEIGEIEGQKGAIKSETADMLSNIDSVLNNPLLGQVVGLKNPLTYWTPGSNEQQVKNQFNQIIASLSLENRKKLKGSGAISDFESRTLERASSALGKNLSNDAVKSELKKVRGVMATANGLSADVQIKNRSTGETQLVKANREQINNMIADGLLVEYK